PGDRFVRIRIVPPGKPTYDMFGLTEADGTPKLDAISLTSTESTENNAYSYKGSWRMARRERWSGPFNSDLVTLGFDASIDTHQCHIAHASALPYVLEQRSWALDAKCLPPKVINYTRPNPA